MSADTNPNAWEQYAPEYMNRLNRPDDPNRAIILPHMLQQIPDDLSGLTVLDVGCGPGSLSIPLSQRGCHVFGIDITQAFIDYAQAITHNGNPRFVRADARTMDLRKQFDMAVSNMALQDMPELKKVIGSIASHLIDGGVFTFSILHPDREHIQRDSVEEVIHNPLSPELQLATGLATYPPRYIRPISYYFEVLQTHRLFPSGTIHVMDQCGRPLSLIAQCQKK